MTGCTCPPFKPSFLRLVAVSVALSICPSVAPMVSIVKQMAAVLGWGLVLLLAPAPAPTRTTLRAVGPLLAAIGLAATGCLASILFGHLPTPPGAAILGVILFSGVVALHGASAGAGASDDWFLPFAIALVLAGVLGACIACVALFVLLGVVLTGSRTALVSLAMLAAWGLLDRQLDRSTRAALAVAPLLAIVLTTLVRTGTDAGLTAREGTDVTSFRLDIWSDTLSLIKAQPWTGVGWGQFNFAWTLTPFAWRPAGLVDNAHDLPLQLAAELGVPAAATIFGLLLWSIWRPLRRVRGLAGVSGTTARCALMIVLVIGLHSMLEYPLWYAYLLLPAAWAWGLLLGAGAVPVTAPASASSWRAWRAMGLLMGVAAVSAWADYRNIVPLFVPTDASSTLGERIHDAQASPLFSYQADYVAITSARPPPRMLPLVVRSSHVLLDGRMMYIWANMLAARGENDKARYLAARLREFDLADAKPWYASCDNPSVAAKPFQCLPPDRPVDWRDFR